ncbi:MAG: sigma-70 family RNA polymerase sigma factor [Lachnospiraceae bacterium]|nr:sigma-70 family RNA polymerase sigma factor [Lachnospiraceae bacterium]
MLLFLAMLENEGDSEKFTKLYQQYKGLAFWVANQVLMDDYLSEDAVQEAFTRIARNFSKLFLKDDIFCNKTKSFIVIVVERIAIDIYRKHKRQQENEIYSEKWEETLFALGDMVPKKENYVHNAIQSLPRMYSEVLVLHYVNDMKGREIAKILGMNENTVRTRIARGKQQLEILLSDWLVREHEKKEDED